MASSSSFSTSLSSPQHSDQQSPIKVNPIHKLDEITINRIAAGEIIQRPSAVLKEMLENSLDASSTNIQIIIKNGGLDYISIQDNGTGIDKNSLSILCERFTTSKISTYDDLESGCTTYGFRGEALASISHVAHLTVLTKTQNDICAYKAKYLDGILVPFKSGDSSTPKPCAGVTGTTITVEDLFYNMLPRRQALKNSNEEYQRMLDVATKYSIHYGDKQISLTCKKFAAQAPDLHTPQQSTTLDNIKICYGPQLAREIIPIQFSHDLSTSDARDRYDIPKEAWKRSVDHQSARFVLDGYVTNANYSCKKSVCIIFINNRLVECQSLRKTIESIYSNYLPRHTHPFLYLSLRMPYEDVDVNVHPTKKEVIFLYEEDILVQIHQYISNTLAGANSSRVFYTQTLLTVPTIDVPTPSQTSSVLPTRSKRPREIVDLDQELELDDPIVVDIDDDADDDNDDEPVVEVLDEPKVSTAKKSKTVPHDIIAMEQSVPANPKPFKPPKKSVDASRLVRTDSSASYIHQYFPSKEKPSRKVVAIDSHDDVDDPITIPPPQAQPLAQSESVIGHSTSIGESSSEPPVFQLPLFCTECTNNIGSSVVSIPDNQDISSTSQEKSTNSLCLCCQKRILPTIDNSTSVNDVSQPTLSKKKFPPLRRTDCQYLSIKSLIQQIEENEAEDLRVLLKKNVFVGIMNSSYYLVQYETKLYLIDYSYLLLNLFYQLTILQFQNHSCLLLDETSVPIRQSILFALDLPIAEWCEEDGSKDTLADAMTSLLISKRELLQHYFSITITEEGYLTTLPNLLSEYTPLPESIPSFLLRLASEPDWEDEELCFRQIAKELSFLFARLIPEEGVYFDVPPQSLPKNVQDTLLNVLLPAIRYYLIPLEEFRDNGTFLQIADLKNLYKIFERC